MVRNRGLTVDVALAESTVIKVPIEGIANVESLILCSVIVPVDSWLETS